MTGKVTLIGAGPGDYDLMTLRGLKRLREADVIMHDILIDMALLDEAKDDAEIINVGMLPGNHRMPQPEIETTIVAKAKAGQHVVRLKGGDSYIFGRGPEEALACYNNDIPVEVVPGITSVSAAPTYAGIPLTYRDQQNHAYTASGFLVVTGQEDPTKAERLNYEVLAKWDGTLVILMGLKNMPTIFEKMISLGRDPQTPAAVIEWGATRKQRVLTGTLASLPQLAQQAGFQVPSSIVVGHVVRLHGKLPIAVGLPEADSSTQ
jgi:uroporphyrin-III C-methyltransferase